MAESSACALCGLPIIGRPVRSDDHDFCCEGCHRVHDVASEAGIALPSVAGRAERASSAAARKAAAASAAGARRETFRIEGMWCASCSLVLEDALMALPGVLDAEVSYAASLARVTRDPEVVGEHEVLKRISVLGYKAVPSREAAGAEAHGTSDLFLRFFVAAAVGMWVSWPTWLVIWPAASRVGWGTERPLEAFTGVFAFIVLAYCGWPFIVGAWRAARVGRATMDTLVVLGTWTAWGYSMVALSLGGPTYFDSAAMITAIVLLGRWLEALGTRDATAALSALASAESTLAWRKVDDTGEAGGAAASAEQVPASEVRPGELVIVRAGERVPVDGDVVDGGSELDRSHLTGEPMPCPVSVGDEVWAGTINLSGLLTIRVTRSGPDTLAGRLAGIVEDAAFAKSHAQRVADALSAVFVPFVIALAGMTALGTVAAGLGWGEAVARSVAVLVVACPCALGLATPLAVSNAVTAASHAGALLRGGPALERAQRLRTVVFDKTGTLTEGLPRLTGFLGIDEAAEETRLLGVALALEAGESHPVAAAVREAAARSDAAAAAEGIERFPGRGIAGVVGGERWLLGSEALLAESGVEVPAALAAGALGARARGELVVWLHGAGKTHALRFADEPRAAARRAVEALRARGLHAVVLSGDARATTASVANAVGIEDVRAEVLPHEKEEVVRGLAEDGGVAFIGDGINDAAALAAADLSMGIESGADVAVLASDVVLLSSAPGGPLSAVPRVLAIADKSRAVIRENLGWAFSYNLIALPLAVTGRLSPVWAAAAMALSSLAVVANSLRIRRAGR